MTSFLPSAINKEEKDKDLRSTDTGVRGMAHPSLGVAVVLEQTARGRIMLEKNSTIRENSN